VLFTVVFEVGFSRRGSIRLVRRTSERMFRSQFSSTVEKADNGSSLSKRILRIRRNAFLYYIAGNVRIFSPAHCCAQLTGHALARVNICIACFQLINWEKGAFFLVDDEATLTAFCFSLSLSSFVFNLENDLFPQSLHLSCFKNIRARPDCKVAKRVRSHLTDLSKQYQDRSISQNIRPPHDSSCTLCEAFSKRPTQLSPPLKKIKLSVPQLVSPTLSYPRKPLQRRS